MRFAQGAVPRNIVIVSVDTWGDVLKGFFRVSKHECNGTESFPDRFGFRVILSSERYSLNKCTSSIFNQNLLMIQTLLCS